MKFNVYIDGYNLYNGLKETSRREPFYKCCYWLDLWKLGKWLEGLHSGWELQAVKFFTAPEHIEPPPNSWVSKRIKPGTWKPSEAATSKSSRGSFENKRRYASTLVATYVANTST